MSQRHRARLILKLFPSVPKGVFGGGRLTALLERNLFYREFTFSPWKLAFVALALAVAGAWTIASLAVTWHVLHETESVRAERETAEAEASASLASVRAAQRDYYLLLSRVGPLDEKVAELASFSQKMATVAGLPDLAAELGPDLEGPDESELGLTEVQVDELERRFERLGTFLEQQQFQLARTPSISPLKETFVPTDWYGYRVNRFLRQAGRGGKGQHFHSGLDLAAPVGTPIHATADATVHFAGRIPTRQNPHVAYYGNFVVLDHGNGIRTVYAHCNELAVESGDEITRGDTIAWVGSTGRSTGPHLHYEVVVDGRPLDPELFILDVAIPRRRVRVDVTDDHSLLVDEVDKLLGL